MAYSKDSLGGGDARNQKLAAGIYVAGFLASHAFAFFIPAHPHFNTIANYIVSGLAVGSLLFLVYDFWRNADLTEDFGWPELLVIALAFASAVLIGYCSTC